MQLFLLKILFEGGYPCYQELQAQLIGGLRWAPEMELYKIHL